LENFFTEKAQIEKRKEEILSETSKLEEILRKILKDEKEIEEELKALEEEERMTKEKEKQIQVEKERQKIQEERREMEKRRWEIEDKIKSLGDEMKTLEIEEKKNDFKIKSLEEKIKKLEEKITPEMIEWFEKEEVEGEIEDIQETSERLKKELEELKEKVREIEEKIKEQKKTNEEFLETKKVSPSSAPPNVSLEEKPEVIETLPEIETPIKIEKLPRKPSNLVRTLVRFLVLVFVFFVFFSLFWFFISKRETKRSSSFHPVPQEPEITHETPLQTPETEKLEGNHEKIEIIVPPSLILVDEEKEIEVENSKEIEEKILKEVNKETAEGKMERIIIKHLGENRLVTLEELLDAFEIWRPEGILEKVEDFTLAIYSQKEGRRIIVVAKIKEGEGIEELKKWEEKIEREGVFVSGKKISTISKRFKEILIKEQKVRFLTVSKNDLGICYSLIGNYFVFSESLTGIEKVIEKIKK